MSKFFQNARVAYKAGKHNEAGLLLHQALVFNSKDAASLHLLGIIEAQQGRFELALQYLDSAVLFAPKELSYAIDRANVLASLGRPADAINEYDRALTISPRIPEALSNRGHALRLLGRNAEAVKSYRDAIAVRPSFAEAHRALGQTYWVLEQLDDAIESFSRALKLIPTDISSLLQRGLCRYNIRRYEDAVGDFKEIIKLVPEHAEAHGRLSMTLNALEQFKLALVSANRACVLDPKQPEWLAQKGQAMIGLDRPAEALREFEKMRDLGAVEDTVFNLMGGAYLDLYEFDKATALYDRSIKLNPSSAIWYYNRGVALGKQRRYREAISAYDEALARDPGHATSHFNMSLAMLVQGDTRLRAL